jgi:hypothetical protein
MPPPSEGMQQMLSLFKVGFVGMQSKKCRPDSLIVPGFMLLCVTGIWLVVDDVY